MNIMVYGRYGRFGLEMMQEMLRRAGVHASGDGIEKTRRWLRVLPEGHPARDAVEGFRDLSDDAGIADLLLNPRERSYTVPEIYEWLEQADLRLQRFFYGSRYRPRCTTLRDKGLLAKAERLPLPEQHSVAEMVRCSLRKHQFVACPRDRPIESTQIDFSGDTWLDYIPVLNQGVRISDTQPEGVAAELHWPTYEAQDARVRLDEGSYRLYQAIDGRRSMKAIIDGVRRGESFDHWSAKAKQLLGSLWDLDFILLRTSAAYPLKSA